MLTFQWDMLILRESNVRRGFGGALHFMSHVQMTSLNFHIYVHLVCICDCHSGIIRSDWVFSCLFACLSERKNLLDRLMLSTPSLLFWKKLGDDLNCWLAHHEPQKEMASLVKIADSWKSFIHVPRLMSIAKEKGGKHSNIFMIWALLQCSTAPWCSCWDCPWIYSLSLGSNDRCKLCLQDSPSFKCIHLPS